MTERYLLDGLHCATCGEKIRVACEGLPTVKSAKLNLAIMTMVIERSEGADLTEKIQSVCDRIEDGVTVSFIGSEGKAQTQKKRKNFALIEIIIGAALLIIGLALHLFGFDMVGVVLMITATLLCAYRTGAKGVMALKTLDIDENMLLTIAVIAAIAIGEYAEAGAVALLFAIGQQIEATVSRRSRKELSALSEIRPDTVHTDNGDKPAEQVKMGEIIIVHPGERIPLDAEVVGGSGSVDASAITGESIPLSVEYGTHLLSGMLNGSGVLKVKVTGDYENSTAARIVKLVEQSAQRKGSAERFITRFAKVYTPVCVVIAILLTVIPWIIGGAFSVEWLRRALVFLVASCPCALVISVPLAFYAGVGSASKKGVLIKGGVYIEALSTADAVGLDKTGTLTTGKLSVDKVTSLGEDVVAIAAAVEAYSDHPIAMAIRSACKKPITLDGSMTEMAGLGVKVEGSSKILVGSARLMDSEGVDISMLPKAAVYVAADGVALGSISVSDTVRDDALGLIEGLRKRKIGRIAIVSGDHEMAVNSVAETCKIDESYPSLMPQDKIEVMQSIKDSARSTIFVGDGINDAPVLAVATVGIAMGMGTDAAIETADVVLSSGSLSALLTAIDVSRRTMRVVKTNIALSIGIKTAVMLSAFFMPMMWAAVVADVVLSVACSINSARLLAS